MPAYCPYARKIERHCGLDAIAAMHAAWLRLPAGLVETGFHANPVRAEVKISSTTGDRVRSAGKPSGDRLRTRLISAAEQVVAQRGLAGATAREIQALANARNASAISYHFGSLPDLMNAVLEDRFGHMNTCVEAGETDPGKIVSAIVNGFAIFLPPHRTQSHFLRFFHRVVMEQADLLDLRIDATPPWLDAERQLQTILERRLPDFMVGLRLSNLRGYLAFALAQLERWMMTDPQQAYSVPIMLQSIAETATVIVSNPVSETMARELQVRRGKSASMPNLG